MKGANFEQLQGNKKSVKHVSSVLNHRACEKTVRGKANHPSGGAEGKQVHCALPLI